jgi:hypothetical protein
MAYKSLPNEEPASGGSFPSRMNLSDPPPSHALTASAGLWWDWQTVACVERKPGTRELQGEAGVDQLVGAGNPCVVAWAVIHKRFAWPHARRHRAVRPRFSGATCGLAATGGKGSAWGADAVGTA